MYNGIEYLYTLQPESNIDKKMPISYWHWLANFTRGLDDNNVSLIKSGYANQGGITTHQVSMFSYNEQNEILWKM